MLLLTGSTGTLGLALTRAARARGMAVRGAARRGADILLDVTNADAIRALVGSERPALIINCAAITALDACERDPQAAHLANGAAPGLLAKAASEHGARFIQISTDHYFTGDAARLHDEKAPVHMVNQYARSKYEGEHASLQIPGTLVIRTNFTGWRGWPEPTFLEWAVNAIKRQERIIGFSDFVTSTIDADTLAEVVLDLAERHADGIYNVASSEPADKATFLRRLASALGFSGETIREGSVRELATPRAESLALDVGKAERMLGRKLPVLDQVLASLVGSSTLAKCAS